MKKQINKQYKQIVKPHNNSRSYGCLSNYGINLRLYSLSETSLSLFPSNRENKESKAIRKEKIVDQQKC